MMVMTERNYNNTNKATKPEYLIYEPIIYNPVTTQQEPMQYKFRQNWCTPNWYVMEAWQPWKVHFPRLFWLKFLPLFNDIFHHIFKIVQFFGAESTPIAQHKTQMKLVHCNLKQLDKQTNRVWCNLNVFDPARQIHNYLTNRIYLKIEKSNIFLE